MADPNPQPLACLQTTDSTDSSSILSILHSNIIQRSTTLSSQDSSLFSQTSISSFTSSLFSQLSIQSKASIHSQESLQSQGSLPGSLHSDVSLLSQSSLGFLSSLRTCVNDGNVKSAGAEFHCISTLKGHDDPVTSLALLGDFLYSASASNDIRVWMLSDLTECSRFGSGKGAVKAISIAGEKIFSVHQDRRIRVWKRSEKKEQKIIHKLVTSMPTVKDYIASFIPSRNYVQIRRHKKRLWIEHVDTISALAVDTNENLLYSGSWDRTVKVWRLSDFKCVESFKAHEDAINAIALSGDGYLYTASADAKIKVWVKSYSVGKKKKKKKPKRSHVLVTTLQSHKSAVNALELSSDGSILYSGACDRAIVVWEREESGQHMSVGGALRGHKNAILCMASGGDVLCSGSSDKSVRVWKKESGTTYHSCIAVLHGHTAPVKCLRMCVSMQDCMIYSGSMDHHIRIWFLSLRFKQDADSVQEVSDIDVR